MAAVDLKTGAQPWRHPVRDTRYGVRCRSDPGRGRARRKGAPEVMRMVRRIGLVLLLVAAAAMPAPLGDKPGSGALRGQDRRPAARRRC